MRDVSRRGFTAGGRHGVERKQAGGIETSTGCSSVGMCVRVRVAWMAVSLEGNGEQYS